MNRKEQHGCFTSSVLAFHLKINKSNTFVMEHDWLMWYVCYCQHLLEVGQFTKNRILVMKASVMLCIRTSLWIVLSLSYGVTQNDFIIKSAQSTLFYAYWDFNALEPYDSVCGIKDYIFLMSGEKWCRKTTEIFPEYSKQQRCQCLNWEKFNDEKNTVCEILKFSSWKCRRNTEYFISTIAINSEWTKLFLQFLSEICNPTYVDPIYTQATLPFHKNRWIRGRFFPNRTVSIAPSATS